MTIEEVFTSFLRYGRGEKNYAPETVKKHKDCYDVWIHRVIGTKEVSEVTRMDILEIRIAMSNKGVGINRQYSIVMTLKAFFKFCRDVLKISVLDPKDLELPKRKAPNVIFLNDDEVKRLRAAIPLNTHTGLRLRTLVEVLLNTGMRISEALALDRAPFERDETEIEIVGKGGKRRMIFFNKGTIQWIKRLLFRRDDNEPAVFVTTGFPRRVDRADVSKMFIKVRRDAQILKKLTPHILRHYVACPTMSRDVRCSLGSI